MQILFDWDDSHLFEFRQGRNSINEFLTGSPPVMPGDEDDMPDGQLDPGDITLAEILTKLKAKVTYIYDFGDSWEHDIVVEKVLSLAPGYPTPAVRCLAGARAAPPEDIGGFPGYEYLLEVLAEKAAGNRKRLPSQYAGLGKFDPEEFPLDDYNHDLNLLHPIVVQKTAIMDEYTRQFAANPPAPRTPFNVQALMDTLNASLVKLPQQAPPKPKKPKK